MRQHSHHTFVIWNLKIFTLSTNRQKKKVLPSTISEWSCRLLEYEQNYSIFDMLSASKTTIPSLHSEATNETGKKKRTQQNRFCRHQILSIPLHIKFEHRCCTSLPVCLWPPKDIVLISFEFGIFFFSHISFACLNKFWSVASKLQ